MLKLAVMGSGQGSNFEAIAKFFEGKNINITCISDIPDAKILKLAENLGIKSELVPFEKNLEYFSKNKFDLVALAGYMRILPTEVLAQSKFINIHPSLLPAFKGKNAILRAFMHGVKVSGITIHFAEEKVDEGRIIAQFPVIIQAQASFDEFEAEIHATEHKLYPIVIEKILSDKVFDFSDLMKSSYSKGSEGGCGGCKNH